MEWMSIFGVLFLMGNRFLLIDCCHQLLGRLRKEKGQVFLARKLSVQGFRCLILGHKKLYALNSSP